MAPGISYDDSGSLASYFGVTALALVLIPFTYIAFRPAKRDHANPLCPCSTCRQRSAQLSSLEGGKRKRTFFKRVVPLLLGWALFVYLCYRISNQPLGEGQKIYNPFEILGISDSSTDRQIKKHYKKLSLQFHPDKIQLAENQTKEEADAHFVELTKAYKSLTDEAIRENLAKYGNPDGPQQREDKIAIPQWVVEGKNNIWVLGAYGLVLGGGIPYIVGQWWFSQRRLTRDGILNGTAELFFHYLQEDTDFISLVTILACALELAPLLRERKRGSKKERKERQARIDELEKELDAKREEMAVDEDPRMRKDNKVTVTSAAAKKARALLWAHLLRVDLNDKGLQAEQLSVLKALSPILNALLNISLAHNWLATSLLVVELQAALVQGLPPNTSPLAQLPDLTPEESFEISVRKGAGGKLWAEKAAKKGALEGDAAQVIKYWPRLEITDASFKVVGERVVTPSSIVQLEFQARYLYPTTSTSSSSSSTSKASLPNGHVTEEEKKENGDANPANGPSNDATPASDAQPRASVVNGGEQSEPKQVGRKGKKEPKKTYPSNGYAHAPRWPQLRKPHYQVLLGDSKLNKVIVQPIKITDLPLPRWDGIAEEPRKFTLQFQAPPQANLYSFVLYAASDTFLGANVDRPMMLKVEDPPEDNELSDDDDISDPEEDTLAGQMAMMRGGKVKASEVHRKDDESDDEDEDGSEYEYESSSDEEGPKGKRAKAINEDSSDSD